ncbi:MAG: hypothetical protein JW802_05520 [Campylobacterales bacterium]|nr:hypothetical protein [Campylobacterales bacterium]MBN2832574.1 hypothetical protein [Campylobacterales bacterium]
MAIHHNFVLDWFPVGTSEMEFEGSDINGDNLFLYYDAYENGLLLGRTLCGYLSSNGLEYSFEQTERGNFAFGVIFYPDEGVLHQNSLKFYFTPNDLLYTADFLVTPSAMKFLLIKAGMFLNSGEPFYQSLNGKYGSFPDDTVVTVDGKEGQFVVKASELFWNDKDTNSYMMTYILSQSGTSKFLMAPDIYVKKVA